MADEIKVDTNPTTDVKPLVPSDGSTHETTSVSSTPNTPPPAPHAKTNTLVIILIVLGFIIVAAGSFLAGRATGPTDVSPSPTVVENDNKMVPTTEVVTPTILPTSAPMPTALQSTPVVTQSVELPTQPAQ